MLTVKIPSKTQRELFLLFLSSKFSLEDSIAQIEDELLLN